MFDFFNRYWWLLFPIAFFVYGAFQSWLSYRSNRETLDLIKTYAASGREPPPELLNRLSKRQNFDADDAAERSRRNSGYDCWYQVVLFGMLCVGFTYAAFANIYGAGEAFTIVAFVMAALSAASLAQDRDGAARHTYRMRRLSAGGIFLFALTLTLAAILWMKGLMYEWFSTMYGVYYFAGSVWMTLGTVYFITMLLHRNGTLTSVLHEHQFYFLGSLMFAFTVFYAYIHFSQYFIIWNANLPEETFWYVLREKGTWWYVGLALIFGHFFLPFLAMLRIDLKLTFAWMTPLCAWTWVMHYVDMAFNVHPVLHPNGYPFQWAWLDLACAALMGGLLLKAFLKDFAAHPPYPLRDPRLSEAMGYVVLHPSPISGGDLDEVDELNGAAEPKGGVR